VLITQTKVINLHGQPVKVFSIDGKLWVSKPSDLKEFKSRRTHEKAICRKCFAQRTMPFPYRVSMRITGRGKGHSRDR
jgi:hypothetical protein